MSTFNTKQDMDENEERSRKVLRNLRRVKAHRSFDAGLQQRLRQRTAWSVRLFAKPIPAYALSAIAIAVLGVVGYYVVLRPPSNVEDQSIQKEERPEEYEVSSPALNSTPDGQSMSRQQATSEQNITPGEPARKGPAPSGTEATIEARVNGRQSGSTSAAASSRSQIEFRYSPEGPSPSQKRLPLIGDQKPASPLVLSGDSLMIDSTKADSVKKLLQNPGK